MENGLEGKMPECPPHDNQAVIDLWFCKKHAEGLSRALDYIERNVADIFLDGEHLQLFPLCSFHDNQGIKLDAS